MVKSFFMSEPIVKFKGVSKAYRSGKLMNHALSKVDLLVDEGESLAIVGTSGSGKSTLLNIIGGLDRDYTGEAVVAGNEISRMSDRALSRFRNQSVGFVFQQFNLLEHLSCIENVALPTMFGKKVANNAFERAQRALDRVGIGDRAKDFPPNLSGGQKQRIAIARAIFNEPRLLLCDEPTGNLDSKTGQQIIDLFSSLNREDKITLIIVTHEQRVSQAARRVIRLEDGRIVQSDETGASMDKNDKPGRS